MLYISRNLRKFLKMLYSQQLFPKYSYRSTQEDVIHIYEYLFKCHTTLHSKSLVTRL